MGSRADIARAAALAIRPAGLAAIASVAPPRASISGIDAACPAGGTG
jgi:hypothetical protein